MAFTDRILGLGDDIEPEERSRAVQFSFYSMNVQEVSGKFTDG